MNNLFYDEGYLAFHNGLKRRDDPYWTKGSTSAGYESHNWCRGWDTAYKEKNGDTSKYPFGKYH
jgi:hypothetical protein